MNIKLNIVALTVALGCTIGFPNNAVAAMLNMVSFSPAELGRGTCGSTPAVSVSSVDGVLEDFNSGAGQCHVGFTARAGGGGVGINGALSTSPVLGGGGRGSATAFAESNIEILISTPADYMGGVIPINFSAHLSGAASASLVDTISVFSRGGAASLTARVNISGRPLNALSGPIFSSSASVNAFASAGGNRSSGGVSDGDLLPAGLVLPTIFINPLEPVEVRFSMSASLRHSGFNESIITATVDAFNSLSFALDGPALILPEGFSANSVSGMIVDNVYVGAPVSAVPLPAALPLFAGGLGFIGLTWWRTRKTLRQDTDL